MTTDRHPIVQQVLVTVTLCLMVFTTGCDSLDSLLSVEDPSRVLAEDIEDPVHAELLVRSTEHDFNCAFVRYIVAGGLVGEEFALASGLIRLTDYDRRTVTPGWPVYATSTCEDTDVPGVYAPLSTARWQADRALELLDGWTDSEVSNRQALIARAAVFAGYSTLLIGEGMCSAAFDQGPELGRQEILARAETRFSRAIEAAGAGADDEVLALAYLGRARTRLRAGDAGSAVEDAREVPPGFQWEISYGTNLFENQNMVYSWANESELLTIGEQYRDMTFDGVSDPRVSVAEGNSVGSDQITPLWFQTKYPAATSPIPLGTWEEAQLILAEGRRGSEAVSIINNLHSRVGLPSYEGGSDADIQRQIQYERRAELFLESHHLGDMIHYDFPLEPAAGEPYPVVGGVYGDQVCFPLPDVERFNNPSIPG